MRTLGPKSTRGGESVVALAVQPVIDPGVAQVEAQGGVAEDLVEVAEVSVVAVDVAERRAGRGVDVKPFVPAELLDSKEVGSVGDDDDVVEVVSFGDLGEAAGLLLGGEGVGLRDNSREGYSLGE